MRVLFSYKKSFLAQFLVYSSLFHLSLLGAGHLGALKASPRYAVEASQTSVDVVIVEEKIPDRPLPEEHVIAREEPPDRREPVSQSVEEKEAQPVRELPALPKKGALEEAKPLFLKNPAPVYPRIARERGWEGVVQLEVFVQKDGRPGTVRILESSGHSALDESALRAVRQWRFAPARVGPVSFASRARIPVRFILES